MNKEIEFDEDKVKKIIEIDSFLYREYENKISNFPERKALEIIFHTYIQSDPVLEDKYKNLQV
jgi:hypothetical protein